MPITSIFKKNDYLLYSKVTSYLIPILRINLSKGAICTENLQASRKRFLYNPCDKNTFL